MKTVLLDDYSLNLVRALLEEHERATDEKLQKARGRWGDNPRSTLSRRNYQNAAGAHERAVGALRMVNDAKEA